MRVDGNLCDFMVWGLFPAFGAPDVWVVIWKGTLPKSLQVAHESRGLSPSMTVRLCPEGVPPDYSDYPGSYLI